MKLFVSIIISFHLVFAHPAFALDVKLGNALNLRNDRKGTFGVDINVPAGTILRIPDKYILYTDGKVDEDRTLNKWLAEGEEQINRNVINNGRRINDNFFKVDIVSYPKNYKASEKQQSFRGKSGYMALTKFVRKGLLKLYVTDEAVLHTDEGEPAASSVADQTEAGTCPGGPECSDPSPEWPDEIKKLKKDMGTVLDEVGKQVNHNIESHALNNVEEKFNSSGKCYGLKFDDFKEYLIEKAKTHNIPPEIMLGILTQESLGDCQAVGRTKKSPHSSVGLFQINTKTASAYDKGCTLSNPDSCKCDADEKALLENKTLQQMESGPKCLENPAYNTELALKVLVAKYKAVNSKATPPSNKKLSEYTLQEKDLMRKALAAYNGGEGYVYQAYADMKTAADTWHVQLDLDNWEQRRIFFFRKDLEERSSIFKNSPWTYVKNRSDESNQINVSYVESIMGRNITGQGYQDYATQWSKELYGDNL